MTAATETLIIQLPHDAMRRLRRMAELARRPLNDVVVNTLESNLPPLLEDVPEDFRATLAPLESAPSAELRELVFAQLDNATVEIYDALLEKKSTGTLGAKEQERLTLLRRQADELMFQKAYAALLLKWRGERVPSLNELRQRT